MADFGDFDPRSVARSISGAASPSRPQWNSEWVVNPRYKPILDLLGQEAKWLPDRTQLDEKDVEFINKFAQAINRDTALYDEKTRRIIARFVYIWLSGTGIQTAIHQIVKERLASKKPNDSLAFAALIVRRQTSFMNDAELDSIRKTIKTQKRTEIPVIQAWFRNPQFAEIVKLMGFESEQAKAMAPKTTLPKTMLEWINNFVAKRVNSDPKYTPDERRIISLFIYLWLSGDRAAQAQPIIQSGLAPSRQSTAHPGLEFIALILQSRKSFMSPQEISELEQKESQEVTVLTPPREGRVETPLRTPVSTPTKEASSLAAVTSPALGLEEGGEKGELTMDLEMYAPPAVLPGGELELPLLPEQTGLQMSPAIDVSDRGSWITDESKLQWSEQQWLLSGEDYSTMEVENMGAIGQPRPVLLKVLLEDREHARILGSPIQILDGIPPVLVGFPDPDAAWEALQDLPNFLHIPEFFFVWSPREQQYFLFQRRWHVSSHKSKWATLIAVYAVQDKRKEQTDQSYDIIARLFKSGTDSVNEFAGEFRLPKSYSRQ